MYSPLMLFFLLVSADFSIRTFTWQSQANTSLIHFMHANTLNLPEDPPLYVREDGTICRFLPSSKAFMASKVDIGLCLTNIVLLESRKSHFGGQKRQIVKLGSKTPNQPKCQQKQWKTPKYHNWPHHIDWPRLVNA